MSRFHVFVVDDEPLARRMVAGLLERDPEVGPVSQYGDAREALAAIRALRPHVVFLDIEMPEMDGLELVEQVEADTMPAFVFVTAYGSYATRAFDVQALDYVVKPFTDARLLEALERAKRRVREHRLHDLAGQVSALATALHGGGGVSERPAGESGYLTRLSARSGDVSIVVPVRDVLWIEAEDYYVRIHSRRGRHLVRASLVSLEPRLDPRRFLRVHRTAIVNLDEVREWRALVGGTGTLVLSDGSRLAVSRARRRHVEEALPLRLSMRRGEG